jgi:hypothetical protein
MLALQAEVASAVEQAVSVVQAAEQVVFQLQVAEPVFALVLAQLELETV